MEFTEKRKSTRVEVDFPATFSHESQESSGRILFLSVDGALLKGDISINAGEIMELTFKLPDHEVRTKARIIWSRPIESTIGMGICFEDIDAVHKAAIESYIGTVLQRLSGVRRIDT